MARLAGRASAPVRGWRGVDEQIRRAEEPLALLTDLAVGVDPDGADAWCLQDLLALDVRVGAPPDEFNRAGQDWATQAYLDAARSIFQAEARPKAYRRLVASIGAPALVIHGAKDRLIPVGAAREAVAGHDGWELVVFDDVGHLPMIEAPDRWLDTVEAWLRAVEAEAPTG